MGLCGSTADGIGSIPDDRGTGGTVAAARVWDSGFVAVGCSLVCAIPRDLGDPGVRRTVRTRTHASTLVGEHPGKPVRDVRIAVVAVWHSDLGEGSPRRQGPRGLSDTNILVIRYQTSGFARLKCSVGRGIERTGPRRGGRGAKGETGNERQDRRAAETDRAIRPACAPAAKPASMLTTRIGAHDCNIPARAASPEPPWP